MIVQKTSEKENPLRELIVFDFYSSAVKFKILQPAAPSSRYSILLLLAF